MSNPEDIDFQVKENSLLWVANLKEKTHEHELWNCKQRAQAYV